MTFKAGRVALAVVVLLALTSISSADVYRVGLTFGVARLGDLGPVDGGSSTAFVFEFEYRVVEHVAWRVLAANSSSAENVRDGDKNATGRLGTLGVLYYPGKLSDTEAQRVFFSAAGGVYDIASKEFGYSAGIGLQQRLSKYGPPQLKVELQYHGLADGPIPNFYSVTVGVKFGD